MDIKKEIRKKIKTSSKFTQKGTGWDKEVFSYNILKI